jgi:hypothetical protein
MVGIENKRGQKSEVEERQTAVENQKEETADLVMGREF